LRRRQPMPDRHPLFNDLHSAIRLAIHHGNTGEKIRHEKWAETYHATIEEVRAAWVHELTKIAPNAIEETIGEGK
jgi:hypothetical protein